MPPDTYPYVYASGFGGNPIEGLIKFAKIDVVLTSVPDAKIVKEAEDLKIDLN